MRGIRVPGGAALSRKQVDEIEAEAKKAGAAGLLRLKFVNGALDGPIAKFLRTDANQQLALAEGELALFVAGPDRVSNPALDRVRQDVARRLNVIPESEFKFLWVTDFPMFERDPVTGALGAGAPSVHVADARRRSACSTARPSARAPRRTTACSTATSWAAGASA